MAMTGSRIEISFVGCGTTDDSQVKQILLETVPAADSQPKRLGSLEYC